MSGSPPIPGIRFQLPIYEQTGVVATLKDELASLRIDSDARAGSRRGGVWLIVLLLVLVGAAGGWFWTQRMNVTPVKTAGVVARSSGSAVAAGAVLNASGYVTARRRATVSSKVTGQGPRGVRRRGQGGQEGPGARPARRLADPRARSRSPRRSWPRRSAARPKTRRGSSRRS